MKKKMMTRRGRFRRQRQTRQRRREPYIKSVLYSMWMMLP